MITQLEQLILAALEDANRPLKPPAIRDKINEWERERYEPVTLKDIESTVILLEHAGLVYCYPTDRRDGMRMASPTIKGRVHLFRSLDRIRYLKSIREVVAVRLTGKDAWDKKYD